MEDEETACGGTFAGRGMRRWTGMPSPTACEPRVHTGILKRGIQPRAPSPDRPTSTSTPCRVARGYQLPKFQGELIRLSGDSLSACGSWRFSAIFFGNGAARRATWSSRGGRPSLQRREHLDPWEGRTSIEAKRPECVRSSTRGNDETCIVYYLQDPSHIPRPRKRESAPRKTRQAQLERRAHRPTHSKSPSQKRNIGLRLSHAPSPTPPLV